jgi:RHS repeat-associated protein
MREMLATVIATLRSSLLVRTLAMFVAFALVSPVQSVHALNVCSDPVRTCGRNSACCQHSNGVFAGCCAGGTCCPGLGSNLMGCCSGTTPNCDSVHGQCTGSNKPPKGGPCKQSGSIIGCETQTLGQAIRVTGTPFGLDYQSDRASGRLGLGGWSLSVHHTYDVGGGTLYLGNGDQVSASAADASFLPGSSVTDIFVAAEDGSEIYVVTAAGRQLRTLDALTGAPRFQFAYDGADRLASISDGDGNVTAIERDGGGNLSAIVAPFGQRTTFAVDGDGYLSRVTNPAGEVVQLTYKSGNAEGLLAAFTDPRGNLHNYAYDALGHLTRDENPAGSVTTLARTDITADHYTVTLSTDLRVVTTYGVEELSTGDTLRARIDPSGVSTESLIRTDGSHQDTYPDGTVAKPVEGPDPRFGMQTPIVNSQTITTPGGLVWTATTERTANLVDPANLLSLTTQTDAVTINGRTYTRTYDAGTHTFTDTTPAGRQSVTTIDAKGRLVQFAVAGISPAQLAYDGRGRLASLTQDNRSYALTYDPQGYVSFLTDPLGRSVGFTYDAAGRPTLLTWPDGKQIGLTYDANGNLVSLTPPGRPSHAFSYTPNDLPQSYAPPDLRFTPKDTQFVYNLDRQLIQLSQPDVSESLSYDVAGRIQSLTHPKDTVSYGYDSASRLQTIATSSGVSLSYGYDGHLLTDTTWSGPVTGTIHRTYDNNFNTTTQTINGANTLTFAYDADGLLVQAGALTLQRDAQNGLLTGTTLGVVADALSYNSFGEPVNYSAKASATLALSTQFTRDKLGRIAQNVETVGGVVHTYDYGYGLAGRLEQVKQDGLVTASYTYDGNGNRLTGPSVLDTATYDDQDRLLSYAGSTYDYTASGELKTKTTGALITIYDYDVLGNLKRVILPGGATIDYIIDGQNHRIGKKVGGTFVQGFLYQDDLKPIAELDGMNNVVSRFVYATGVNLPDYMVKGGQVYRIIIDHLGSPRLVVNVADGSVAQKLSYGEFGKVTVDTNPGFQPFGFAGGLYDRDTKLVRFGARDYDAETGRWDAKDPLRFNGGDTNLYGYVLNDPVNLYDPQGAEPSWKEILKGWAALAKLYAVIHGEYKFPPEPDKPTVPIEPASPKLPPPLGPPPPPPPGGILVQCGTYLTVIGSRLTSFVPPVFDDALHPGRPCSKKDPMCL